MTLMQAGAIPTITLAHRLRIAREFAGLEQAELAQRADMSRTSVVNYELGYRVPRRLYLRAIAEATGVDVNWLETGEAPAEDADASIERARRDSNPQPSGWEPGGFWTEDRAAALLVIECQAYLDADSHSSEDVS